MKILAKKASADRAAQRATTKTGQRHMVASTDGGYTVILAAAAEKAPKAAAKSIKPAIKKAAKPPVAAPPAAAPDHLTRGRAKSRQAAAAAANGTMPTPPDFTAATHKPFRAKLARLIELADAGDADGLEAVAINPTSTSPKALIRYRDLAALAIRARAAR